VAAFGGSAWTYDERRGQWYLHSFYPEQPDLDWRNPEPVAAMQEVLRFWLYRGVDGFRIDAIDRLMKDPELRDDPPRTRPFPFPLNPEEAKLEHAHSRNGPGTSDALKKIRQAVGPDAFLVGEVYLPSEQVGPYLDHFDRFFVFELLFAGWDRRKIANAIEGAKRVARREGPGPAWVMSNHDFGWLASRVGREHVEEALELLLSLPGTVFLYQGDEFGMENGPDTGGDRYGRDAYRTPLEWKRTPLVEKTRQLIARRREFRC
jgi:alpha-glucosidase